MFIQCSIIPSPLGELSIATVRETDAICALGFSGAESLSAFQARVAARYGVSVTQAPAPPAAVRDALSAYFDGTLRGFDPALVITPALGTGTPFQQRVWSILLTIPYGTVRSYQWVAVQLGTPSAARAVGQANSANLLPIIIPCHRVVTAAGGLGGYSGRPEVKSWLLTHEGAPRDDRGRFILEVESNPFAATHNLI